jgi:predicted RNA-binding Zn ribbon-like protein
MAMPIAPAPLSSAADLPFKHIGGDPSLDLVNTVDWTSRGLELERITDYDRLTRWAEGAGVIGRSVAERLRRSAATRPREAAAAVAAAVWLRWVLQRVFAAVASSKAPGRALDEFNELLADALPRMRLTPSSTSSRGALTLTWDGMGESLASPLWPVIWSAAQLIASDEVSRIHMCAGPDCGWLYVDRSRNKLRRWCEMETCGTREKSRRRYRQAKQN